MKQASPKPPLCRVNLEVKQITAVFAQEFLFWASVKSKRKQRYLRYQLLVYWLLQQIDSLYFVLLITGANMLNQKSNLHDVVPTSDSSALEHLASNVATNVGTVITAPAPALEAQNAEEDSLPLFLTQAAAQVAAALNVAGTTATQGVSATPAATALFPEHNATADAITATASANAASTSVAATSDAAIADNDVATDAIVASATEVAMSDPATASDTNTDTADTTTSADTTTATATATVIADNVSVVDANIASHVEVAMSDPATVSDTTTDTTTTSSDAAITTTATATATAIADDASVIDSSVASTAEVVMSDPATVSNSNTTLDTTTLDATDASTDIASTTTATTTATTKKGKRSTRAKKPRQPKRTHFPPEPVTNTSEQILSQPKALKQSQQLQVLASSDDEAIQKLLTPQQLAAFSNANANSSTERLEQVDKLLGVLLRHRGEDKIFLDTLMQESGMSCDAVTEGMRKLRSLEIIRMYSTYVRFYDLESADVYLNTVVRTNEQRKSYSVKYPQEDIKNGILSVEEAFGFYLLKSRKAISFADFTEVVATACTDLEPVQELLVLLYRCGKVQLQDNVLYFVPKKRIPRKAKRSPTSQGGPAGSPAGGQGLAPNGAVATNGASTPAPAASASGATAESAAPTEGKASVEAMTTSSESLEAVSAVPVEATRTEPVKAVAVDTALSVRCNELAEAPVAAVAVDATVTSLGSTATASEAARIESVVAVSEAADTSLAAPKSAHVAACVAASAVSVASAAMPAVPSSGPVAAPVTAKTTAVAGSRHEHLRPSELATAIAAMGTSFGGCSSKMREAPLAITCPVPEIQPRGSLALPSGSLAKYDPADVLEPVLSVQALQRTYGDEMGAAFHE